MTETPDLSDELFEVLKGKSPLANADPTSALDVAEAIINLSATLLSQMCAGCAHEMAEHLSTNILALVRLATMLTTTSILVR
jgi:hypothetical protein